MYVLHFGWYWLYCLVTEVHVWTTRLWVVRSWCCILACHRVLLTSSCLNVAIILFCQFCIFFTLTSHWIHSFSAAPTIWSSFLSSFRSYQALDSFQTTVTLWPLYYKILLEQSFTASILLLMATSALRLGKRCQISLQQRHLHLCTLDSFWKHLKAHLFQCALLN